MFLNSNEKLAGKSILESLPIEFFFKSIIDAYFFWPDILKDLSKHQSKPHHFVKLLKMEIG
jgi:hypothetical protein